MLSRAQLQTAGELLDQLTKWREERLIAEDAVHFDVFFAAPVTTEMFMAGAGNRKTSVHIEPDRSDPIKAAVIVQLDVRIAAAERELAKLGVTAD